MAEFKEIIGHESLIHHLQVAIRQDKVSHAYLFQGEALCGKKLVAQAFAKALLCENEKGEACGVCHSCKQAESGNHPDIIRVIPSKETVLSVEDVRTQINADISIKPYQSRYKIYLIADGDRMNEAAQNALLKTMEEPPEYAVLVIMTTNAEHFLPTIRSRCVTLNFRWVSDGQIREYLMKQYQLTDYRAAEVVSFAQGNVGKAIMLASSSLFTDLRDRLLSCLRKISERNILEISQETQELMAIAEEKTVLLDMMTVWFRDVLLYKTTKNNRFLIFKDSEADIKREAKRISESGLAAIFEAIKQAKQRIKSNVSPQLTMEVLFDTIRKQMI